MDRRALIKDFMKAFGRPIRNYPVELNIDDRILLGNLMLEEAIEYVSKGLGLSIEATTKHPSNDSHITFEAANLKSGKVTLICSKYKAVEFDMIESADALGDIGVVNDFNAFWHGFNLDKLIEEINDSNMSKLGEDGMPIINGHTVGFRVGEAGYDPNKPQGKILKSENYREPDIAYALGFTLDLEDEE